jgi:uncharacterized DUF497 family protein
MTTRFEWDENKDRANIRKHGIDFQTAARVFADPNSIVRHERVVEGEQRWHVIGSIGGFQVILVVHTLRESEDVALIRIISARKATRKERKLYEENDENGFLN